MGNDMENDDVDFGKIEKLFTDLISELGEDRTGPLVILPQLGSLQILIEEINKNDKGLKKLIKTFVNAAQNVTTNDNADIESIKTARKAIDIDKKDPESIEAALEWLSVMLHGSKSKPWQEKKKMPILFGTFGLLLTAAIALGSYNLGKNKFKSEPPPIPIVSEEEPIEVKDKNVLIISPDPPETDLRHKFIPHQIGNELIMIIKAEDTTRRIYDNEIEFKFSETSLAAADRVQGLAMEVYVSGTSCPDEQEVLQVQPFFILGEDYSATDHDSQATTIYGKQFNLEKNGDASVKAYISFDTRYLGDKYGNKKLHKLVLRFLPSCQNIEWIGFDNITIIWNDKIAE